MMNSESNNQPRSLVQNQRPWLIQQAMSLVAWSKTGLRQRQLKRVPASLMVDSFAEGTLQGVRGGQSLTRQLIYEAGPYHICFSIDRLNTTQSLMKVWRGFQNPKASLSIDHTEPTQGLSILGQWMFMGEDAAKGGEADIELLKETRVIYSTQSNEFGEFALEGLSEGVYDLRIRVKGEELNIAGLNAMVSLN